MFPRYEYPPILISQLARAVLFSRRRDFRLDARACIRRLAPPLQVLGEACVPQDGPSLVVMNHYFRPGFHVWWLSMAISALLPMEHTWLLASEWTAPGKWYEPVKAAYSRFVARRLAQVYGFIRMPPMPPRPRDAAARAASVRAALAYAGRRTNAVLCMAPEGSDAPDARLSWPPPGVGRFFSLLAEGGLRIVPVGGWEESGALKVRFGPPIRLQVTRRAAPAERDRLAADAVMRGIAALLPASLRGEFA